MKCQRYLVFFMIFLFFFTSSFSIVLAENGSTIKFSDVKDTDWFYEYVQKISSTGLVKGAGKDDVFAPYQKLTVAEMLTVILRALNENTENLPSDANWYDGVIRKSKELGLVLEGEFTKYDIPIKRGEMSRIIIRALNKLGNEDFPKDIETYKGLINDYESIPDDIKQYVLKCFYLGILTGIDSKGTFNHNGEVTRAEMSAIIVRTLYPEYRASVVKQDDAVLEENDTMLEENDATVLEDGDYYMQIYDKYIYPAKTGFHWLELHDEKPDMPFTVKLYIVDEKNGPSYVIKYGDEYIGLNGNNEGAQLRSIGSSAAYLWRIDKFADFCTIRKFNEQNLVVIGSDQMNVGGTGPKVIVWSHTDIPDNAKIKFVKAN